MADECRRCGFAACICHRGERDARRGDYIPRDFGDEYASLGGQEQTGKQVGQGKEATMEQATVAMEPESKASKTTKAKKSGPGSRSVTLPAEVVEEFFRSKGFVRGVVGNEVTFERAHQKCVHVKVTVYTSLPARSGGDSRGVGEDAIRVTTVFVRQTPGRDRPYVKIIHKSPRVYRTGSVEGCLERAIERAREAYAAGTEFLRAERCFECEKRASGFGKVGG